MYELNQQRILKRNRNSQRRNEKYLISTPNQGSYVGEERFLGLLAAMEGGERVEFAAWKHAVAGQSRAVIDRSGGQIDP